MSFEKSYTFGGYLKLLELRLELSFKSSRSNVFRKYDIKATLPAISSSSSWKYLRRVIVRSESISKVVRTGILAPARVRVSVH